MSCKEIQLNLEGGSGDAATRAHVAGCDDCRAYLALERWSAKVLVAGQVEVAPPLMSAVWASIHRASEQAWDSALTRSFRYLLPYMVAVVAVILLVGGLGLRGAAPAASTAAAATTSLFAPFNGPETPVVATVMNADLTSTDPAELLGGGGSQK